MTDIKTMILETELAILGKRDLQQRFAKKYPPHELDRMRRQITVHEAILKLLKDIEEKARP